MKKPQISVFDFDNHQQWRRVLSIVNDPLVCRALQAGMKLRCSGLEGKKWDGQRGPWEYAMRDNHNWPRLQALSPNVDDPNWYRIFGYCGIIAPWCAAVGSLLFPDHQWYYAYNLNVPRYGCHVAGLGFKENPVQSLQIMDILFGPPSLREGTENWLAWVLTNEHSKHVPFLEAITRLESGDFTLASPLTRVG